MPYKTADKVIMFLVKQYTKLFRKARNIASFDELNVIELSHEIYDESLSITKTEITRLAQTVYKKHRVTEAGEPEPTLDNAWVLALLLAYNPVTKYVYENEVDRKRARFAESLIASDTPVEEVEPALRLWVRMNKQLADDVTFDTMVKAYADSGVEKVRWVTHEDDRRCKECKSRHGKIYPIAKIPPKPHRNCRCYVEPAGK
jgi:hypothetical protein